MKMEFLLAVKTLYPEQMSLNHDRYLKTLPSERRVPAKFYSVSVGFVK